MPELRQDIVTGRWVVVATGRAMRPTDFGAPAREPVLEEEDCPFCPGNEAMTPPELTAVRPPDTEPDTPGWKIRVVPNKFPAFSEEVEMITASEPMFPRRPASGGHEVIVHTPDHLASLATISGGQVELVLRIYRQRYRVQRRKPGTRHVHIIVNHGREAGASLEHSHSQLFAMPIVPPAIEEELAGASWRKTNWGECVFCRMISRELELGERVVCVSERFVAIAPFASRLPFETWILPRIHQESFDMIDEGQIADLADMLKRVLAAMERRFSKPPYNYYIHTAPCDRASYPYYHWHLEMIPKLTVPGAFELGTSMMINVINPERAASYLAREISGSASG